MSAWVGVAPLIGAGSLDGFAIGALASGTCFLAITALRRGRKRYAVAVNNPASHDGWLCEHVMAAEAFPAYAERVAQPDILDFQDGGEEAGVGAASRAARFDEEGAIGAAGQEGAAGQPGGVGSAGQETFSSAADQAAESLDRAFPAAQASHRLGWAFPSGRAGRAARSYRSRHRRLGDPIPDSASVGCGFPGGADEPREATFPGEPRESGCPDDLIPAGTSRHAAFPDSAWHGGASRGGAHRLPELAFPDDTYRASKRPEIRSLPRHAAPGTSLSKRLSTRMSSLMTSLAATRALTGGAHG